MYEYSESVADGVTYFYGLNRTHNSEGEIYVYNAHGDVVQLVKDNAVEVSYTYDAFGNLTAQIGESNNPFLYCGEYYDAESQTYYLRARYYDPANGRFNAEDTHWSLSNMLYGDSPVKMNEHEDALGLNQYTLLPSILSVSQSSNLYVYCTANPVRFVDFTGKEAIIAGGILLAVAEAALEAVIVAGAVAVTIWSVNTISNVVSTAIASRSTTVTNEKVVAQEKEAEKNAVPSQTTIIYRYGNTNPGNLTPKEKDINTGLSFSTKPPMSGSYSVTTIEAINATGRLIAIQDGPDHVSVIPSPNMGTLQDWIETGTSHPCTAAVKSVVVKVR